MKTWLRGLFNIYLSYNVFHNLFVDVFFMTKYFWSLVRHNRIVLHAWQLSVAQSFSSISLGLSLRAWFKSCWHNTSSISHYHVSKFLVSLNFSISNFTFVIVVLTDADEIGANVDVIISEDSNILIFTQKIILQQYNLLNINPFDSDITYDVGSIWIPLLNKAHKKDWMNLLVTLKFHSPWVEFFKIIVII